jgi:hypothetical protein
VSRKAVILAVLGLVLAAPAGARPVQVMPGVTYDQILRFTGYGPVRMYVITAPRPGGLYSLTPLLSNGTITGRETVSSMERDVSTQMTTIGVNGDFFNWTGGWPSGLLLQGGVLEHQPAYRRASVGIDNTGSLHVGMTPWAATWRGASGANYQITDVNQPPGANAATLFTPAWGPSTPAVANGTAATIEPFPPATPFRPLTGTITSVGSAGVTAIPRDGAVIVGRAAASSALRTDAVPGTPVTVNLGLPPDWANVTDAVSGGPTLVRNGQPVANAGEDLTPVQLNGREPRTAIGQSADGRIVLVAVDGRRPGWSAGITNWDLALTLVRYGCVSGFALDSGGSTTVAFDGTLLNRPSDTTGERPVGEALVIGYTGVYAPPPAPTLSPNADGLGDRETLSYKLVRPSTVSAKLVFPDGTALELDSGQKPAGRYRVSWNGTSAAGGPAPEGRYHWIVTATDDLGRASTADRTFTVDDTLGFVRIGRNARRISFTLTRPARIRVTIETSYGDILRTIAAGPRAPGRVSVRWNGKDGRHKRLARGIYVVRVAASSAIGLSEARIPVRISR